MNGEAGAAELAQARAAMMALLRRHVADERVLAAMAAVPREEFVPRAMRSRAFDDRALPIGYDQTISQPLMVAIMLEALRLRADDRALEVGTGSGYQAALLARLAADVTTVEILPPLLERARELLAAHAPGVEARLAGDMLGAAERAPYDAIVVAAAAPHVPRTLMDQLGPGGRLVIPIGGRREQHVVRVTRTTHGAEIERLGGCAFVPLLGREGWERVPEADGGPIAT